MVIILFESFVCVTTASRIGHGELSGRDFNTKRVMLKPISQTKFEHSEIILTDI